MHLPILQGDPRIKVHGVMDIDEASARSMAELSAAEYWTTDLDRILTDSSTDTVLITTRHNTHAEISIAAARAGKHVFCEKPMALNLEDCRKVAEAVREAGVKYSIGYNRGLAPMIEQARKLLASQGEHKKMMYHRLQAPFPEDSWTHDPTVGGGRFVGEGCHIFDLFCRLTDSPVTRVYAAGGTFLDPQKVTIPDSALVTLSFEDGSVATVLINSAGCGKFPKEATEIYCDGKAIYIENFKHMQTVGYDSIGTTVTNTEQGDKGHTEQMTRFFDAVAEGTPAPNDERIAIRAALLSYKVVESLESGGPINVDQAEYAL